MSMVRRTLIGGPCDGETYTVPKDMNDLVAMPPQPPLRADFFSASRPSSFSAHLPRQEHYSRQQIARRDAHPCAAWLYADSIWDVMVWVGMKSDDALARIVSSSRRADQFEIREHMPTAWRWLGEVHHPRRGAF